MEKQMLGVIRALKGEGKGESKPDDIIAIHLSIHPSIMRHCSRLHVKSCPQPPWPPLTSERDPVAVWLAGCGPAGCDNHYLQCRVIGPAFRPAFK